MRVPRSAVLALLLLAPAVVAGCVSDPIEYGREYKDGFGFVQIWVNRPILGENYPIEQIVGVPRFIAFVAGDNATESKMGPGYTDMALGWSPDWLETEPDRDDWPADAQKDWWRQESTVWYEGQVPAGCYSVVRIEVVEAWIKLSTGAEPPVDVKGDRLSVAPAEGDCFQVEQGKDVVLAFESKLDEEYGRFTIH